LVRSYRCHPTATESICAPSAERIRPAAKRRTTGMRMAARESFAKTRAIYSTFAHGDSAV
jgi:hypothetical protein